MEKKYTLNDVSDMTGTSIRTLRTDIRKGWLTGNIIDGKWEFIKENLDWYFAHSEIRKRIRVKGNAPAYDFLDALGCEKPEACMIYDVAGYEIAEEKNRLLYEQMKDISQGNCGYTYYFDEGKACGRFVIIGSLHYVAKVIDILR